MHGRRKALYTIFGGALGFVVVIALSMFGIGALLQSSLAWLTVMKWAGGAYLVWLGIQVWRAPPIGIDVTAAAPPRAGWSLFRQGALSALTNPKGILFFAAFKHHIGFYPPITGDAELEAAAAPYAGDKGNLRFPLDQPIPFDLIERLTRLRVEQDRAQAAGKTRRAGS